MRSKGIHGPRSRRAARAAILLLAATVALAAPTDAEAQLSYTKGQTVSPAYEGFEVNEDGSYNLIFGYMNRNWLEEVDVPVGPDNHFSPGPADRGQPTHFLPRRNRFTFKVRVPADFGDQELVWTLTTRGETKRAYATLRQDLLIDNMVIASETGALGAGRSDPETRSNVPPTIELETGAEITARVGEEITLVARVTDDGLPLTRAQRAERARAAREAASAARKADEEDEEDEEEAPAATAAAGSGERASADAEAGGEEEEEGEDEEEPSPEIQALRRALNEPARITVGKAIGLHFMWFVYRGGAHATFAPVQIKSWEDTRAFQNSPWAPFWEAPAVPEDGRWIVRVAFDEPGTYVVRGRADDGALYADREVTIRVLPLVN